jgi:hypothetical protein
MTSRRSDNTGESQIFSGLWWSVEVPQGWRADRDKECVTFRTTPPLGAFQISAARKDQEPVTDQDLKEFAKELMAEGIRIDKVSYGPFSGFFAQYSKKGLFWQEWWLGSGRLMVYATYNVVQGSEHLEGKEIEGILSSLAGR